MTDVAVIIVSWNSRTDLLRCLPSVAQGARQCRVETTLVDNASTDDSVDMARTLCPTLNVIQNRSNEGFAAANNKALRHLGARYALLLNADTLLLPGAIDSLVSFMDAHPEAWACGPGMLNGDGTPQRTGIRFPNLWNIFVEAFFLDRLFPYSRLFGRHRALYDSAAAIRSADYVQGSCLMLRASAIAKVGVLDESFYMYFEETDWCYRAHKAGGEVFIVPDAQVIHFGGGAEGHYDENRLIYYHRSLLAFFRKHHGTASILFLRIVLLKRAFVRLAIWSVLAVVNGKQRTAARSAVRGYLHVLSILLQGG